MSEQKMIMTGADLRARIRAGYHLEHDVKGYFLVPSLERVNSVAVAEERVRIERMKEDLGIVDLAV